MNTQKNLIRIGVAGLIFAIVTIGPALGYTIFGPLASFSQNASSDGVPNDPMSWLGDPLTSLNERLALVYGVFGVIFALSLLLLVIGLVKRRKEKAALR
jgi:MFS family permease